MRIAVCGLTGSGKSTLGEELSKALNIPHISYTFKDLAKEKGISLMEFQKLAEKDSSIDKEFDLMVIRECKRKKDFIISTWLGGWYDQLFGIKFDLKIWVNIPDKINAERVSKRDGISLKEASEHIRTRNEENHMRYKSLYGIDIYNQKGFDLFLDSGTNNPKQLVELVKKHLKL